MTDKLAGKLDYTAATRAAIAKWMDVGAKKTKRNFRRYQETKTVTPRESNATIKPK